MGMAAHERKRLAGQGWVREGSYPGGKASAAWG